MPQRVRGTSRGSLKSKVSTAREIRDAPRRNLTRGTWPLFFIASLNVGESPANGRKCNFNELVVPVINFVCNNINNNVKIDM